MVTRGNLMSVVVETWKIDPMYTNDAKVMNHVFDLPIFRLETGRNFELI